jgi:GSH-dependent disulfide-bond oxidoreductase
MLTVYVTGGPNPRKITIFLEEIGVAYNCKPVDVYSGEQRSPEFLMVNPNGRLPALRDTEGPDGEMVLWESGAILQYLAEKTGQLLPQTGATRYEVLKWVYFQVAHAPYLGNAHIYRVMYREALPEVIKRFTIESTRIYDVLNDQLASHEFVAGDQYSIADIAWYPWIEYHDWQGQTLYDFSNIDRWYRSLRERPAVLRGASIPWPYTECGTSEMGQRAKALIDRRLKDPAFALSARPEDAWAANLGLR